MARSRLNGLRRRQRRRRRRQRRRQRRQRRQRRRRQRRQQRRPLAASNDNKSDILCAVENAERGCHVSQTRGGKLKLAVWFETKEDAANRFSREDRKDLSCL